MQRLSSSGGPSVRVQSVLISCLACRCRPTVTWNSKVKVDTKVWLSLHIKKKKKNTTTHFGPDL